MRILKNIKNELYKEGVNNITNRDIILFIQNLLTIKSK